ncbi:hypothetical protein H5410_053136 [Solanum commersonii]|uniref:Uncharacterized protein n=1 Tax=Solanum commersonii TaxID=4109 RepID=A0A9J5X544_SOLCO|nr:hypothetical protein H5410_053136 [Solanum commersonii]
MNEDRVIYIKMLSGRLSAKKLSANALTDFNELRSSFRISIRAVLFSFKMRCFASFAASIFLAAIITWAFLRAKTLVVSKPMPLAPPVDKMHDRININYFKLTRSTAQSIIINTIRQQYP